MEPNFYLMCLFSGKNFLIESVANVPENEQGSKTLLFSLTSEPDDILDLSLPTRLICVKSQITNAKTQTVNHRLLKVLFSWLQQTKNLISKLDNMLVLGT